MYPRKTQSTMNKFHVFTVGKNTRNRQLIYFYLPPYFFSRLSVSCPRACCLRTGPFKTFSIFLFAILTVFIAIAPHIVLKLSKVSVQKLKLRMKRIFMILIIRYNFEINDNDHPYSLLQMLTLNFAIANARLVTLAPGLRPERRFAPFARGLYTNGQSSPFHVFHWSRVYHVRVTKLDCLSRISARGRQRVIHR